MFSSVAFCGSRLLARSWTQYVRGTGLLVLLRERLTVRSRACCAQRSSTRIPKADLG